MFRGGVTQFIAAFLLLALSHYFAAAFLPVADCDETFNFVEPVHFLLYEKGLQTWENTPRFALRSWFFAWVYAGPAWLLQRYATGLRNVDVYFFIRILYGRVACLAELFFVYSIWESHSGKMAMVAFTFLALNYPIPYAGVSVLPTSFTMGCFFIALGSWLRLTHISTSRSRALTVGERLNTFSVVFFTVTAAVVGWPFTGLIGLPMGLDLLYRLPVQSTVCLIISMLVLAPVMIALDSAYYCRITWSTWNIIQYNVFGGEGRGPELYGTEPWTFFFKNLLLNFHIVFLLACAAPLVVLISPYFSTRGRGAHSKPSAQVGGLHPKSKVYAPQPVASGDLDRNSAPHRATADSPSPQGGVPVTGGSTQTGFAVSHDYLRSRRQPRVALSTVQGQLSPPSELLEEDERKRDRQSHTGGSKSDLAVREGVNVSGITRIRALVLISPFFLWFAFWLAIPHKEERFMVPVYPFLILAATFSTTQIFFPSGNAVQSSEKIMQSPLSPQRASDLSSPWSKPAALHSKGAAVPQWRSLTFLLGYGVLFLFGLISFSRGYAMYHFYAGPQRLLYDQYEQVQALHNQSIGLTNSSGPQKETVLCLGKEWYRYPSSFFADPRIVSSRFIKTPSFSGALPLPFMPSSHSARSAENTEVLGVEPPKWGSCASASENVNDLNREIVEQYVASVAEECDLVLDSDAPPGFAPYTQDFPRDVFRFSVVDGGNHVDNGTRAPDSTQGPYVLLDPDHTPLWCRVLYYPFGITQRCARMKPVSLWSKRKTQPDVSRP